MQQLIGGVTITWNSVALLWYLIFTGLLHETPRKKVDIIFQQFFTGSAQRQMIVALADVVFGDLVAFSTELKRAWTKQEALRIDCVPAYVDAHRAV